VAARERVIAAGTELLEGGRAVRFTVEAGGRELPAFAIRFRGRVHAYLNVCAHEGLELDWLPGEFFDVEGALLVCATHGAVYAPDTGRCSGGPCAGAGLVKLPIREREDGTVVLSGPGR
jgi:nitrite reductase/ring-hydroxylating ferredoxin subunit